MQWKQSQVSPSNKCVKFIIQTLSLTHLIILNIQLQILDEIKILFEGQDPVEGQIHNLGIWKQHQKKFDKPFYNFNENKMQQDLKYDLDDMPRDFKRQRSSTTVIPDNVIRQSVLGGIKNKVKNRINQDFLVIKDQFDTINNHYTALKQNAASLRKMERIYSAHGLETQIKNMKNQVAMMEQANAMRENIDNASWEDLLLLQDSDKQLLDIQAQIWALNNLIFIVKDAMASGNMPIQEGIAELRRISRQEFLSIKLQQKIVSHIAAANVQ